MLQKPMAPWDLTKRAFNVWEKATAKVLDRWLENPAVLEPAGAWLGSMMKLKQQTDKMTAAWWGAVGLPTKRDQERTLHLINQLHSRVMDLEEQLADAAALPAAAQLPADPR